MKKIGLLLMVCLMGVAAQAALIDDFSDTDLSQYTLSAVNDGTGLHAVSFASPTGDIRVSKAADTAHEQVLFLRDDYHLNVGETLLADVTGTVTNWDRDLGIAVGYSKTPPSLAPGATGDVRTSYVEVSVRANNQVVSYARKDAVNLASGQEFSGSLYNNPPPAPGGVPQVSFTMLPDSLYITRLTETKFEVGWIDGGIQHALTGNNALIMPYDFTGATNVPGFAIGFYADVRATIAGSPVGLDNLRIIPEPATMLLLGIGSILALRRRK
jgi:hypothetical protein